MVQKKLNSGGYFDIKNHEYFILF